MFDKTFELPLAKTYVAHWGLVEGVREIVQNALDSDSPFVYEFDREDDGTFSLVLRSEFSELGPSTLLLGTTSKAEATDKIGSFGEGYKIAMLVLTRLQYRISIWNGDKVWTPFFRWSNRFESELLCVREDKAPAKHTGLTFTVSGLDEDDCEAIRGICLKMQRHIGEVRETSMGRILIERPGKLYVGSLFVNETKTVCGYDIDPEHVSLERDRRTVDTWSLNALARAMWYETEDFDTISKMIVAKAPEMQGCRYDAPAMVKQAVYRWFQENYEGQLIAATEEELRNAIEKGMTKYVHVGDDIGAMVKSVTPDAVQVKKMTPTEQLEKWWADAKYMKAADRERAFHKLLEQSRRWRHS